MDRRSALKIIGIGMGATVTMGSYFTTLIGCKNDMNGNENSTALFLKKADEKELIRKIVDLILPKTETPSASEVGVVDFIDASIAQLYKPIEQAKFTAAFKAFKNAIGGDSSDEKISAVLDTLIGEKTDEEAKENALTKVSGAKTVEELSSDSNSLLFAFADAIKSLTINGFYGSEVIGKQHLTYLPIPGPYEGCIDYDGRAAYSLN